MCKSAWSEVLGLGYFWFLVNLILRDRQVDMRQGQVEILMHSQAQVQESCLPWTEVACVCTVSHWPK